ncbi:MAG: hypothetical protein ACLP81_03145 [Acidimicrobiales bacterium]
MATAPPYATPATESQAAEDLLAYLDEPSTGPSDPREEWLVAWETDEATFREGNVYNPWDVMPVWTSAGKPVVTSEAQGLATTSQTLHQAFDAPILQALEDPNSSLPSLEAALGASNWSGGGQNSAEEQAYAEAIASDLGTGDVAASAKLTSINWDPLHYLGEGLGVVTGSATSALAGSVGVYILKGVLSLIGAGMVLYGAVIMTGREASKVAKAAAPAAQGTPGPGPGSEPPAEPFPEEAAELAGEGAALA